MLSDTANLTLIIVAGESLLLFAISRVADISISSSLVRLIFMGFLFHRLMTDIQQLHDHSFF
jgi:hypothetical protein